jgi:hypothetical protein
MMFEYDGFLWTMNYRGKTNILGEPIAPAFITIEKHSLIDGEFIYSSQQALPPLTYDYPRGNSSPKRTFCVLHSRPTIVEIQFDKYTTGYLPRTIAFVAYGIGVLNTIGLEMYMDAAASLPYPTCTIYSLGIFRVSGTHNRPSDRDNTLSENF